MPTPPLPTPLNPLNPPTARPCPPHPLRSLAARDCTASSIRQRRRALASQPRTDQRMSRWAPWRAARSRFSLDTESTIRSRRTPSTTAPTSGRWHASGCASFCRAPRSAASAPTIRQEPSCSPTSSSTAPTADPTPSTTGVRCSTLQLPTRSARNSTPSLGVRSTKRANSSRSRARSSSFRAPGSLPAQNRSGFARRAPTQST